ncbi:hypothetical protein [Streptomyces akebiae]|uniref:Translation initiation factor IF-2 n=1 Tax=Streptomyces akebiae TaxID=2865673 RepID=A0ABX8XN63_9ACTN|nr:hypothetical protein [Streptomyces akebiae]QYX77180.1 hypothetical protein K1J60_12175 [Streptomyces akebiae]
MSEQPKRNQPQPQHTDFESMTHPQLVAMLESANAESAYDLAAKLSKAASTITKIGDDLMTYVKGLEWQGEAGDTFREWGGQTASATLHLGEYAEVASRWMGVVSQAIAEAKAVMPDTSETTAAQADLRTAEKSLAAAKEPGARNDPDARKLAQTAQSDATAAQGRIDAARYEAVQQMRKLAQTYQQSAAQVNGVEPPTFVPPAEQLGHDEWRQPNEYIAVTASGASTAGTSASPYSDGRNHSGSGPQTEPSRVESKQGTDQVSRSQPVSMGIDGLATLPESPNHGLTPPVSNGITPRPETPSQIPPGAIPPSFNGGGSGPGQTTPGRLPSVARSPLLPGQGTGNGGVARMPRESGIMGGRPVTPTSGRLGGIPRGTVIGGESTQGRTPMGRGIAQGMPGGTGTNASQSSATGGRRMASEAGGVAGRPAQAGRTSSRPFTPGGAGLLRPGNMPDGARASAQTRGDATPTSRNATPSQRNQRDRERPGYLSEEEQTWQQNHRRALPPVVD